MLKKLSRKTSFVLIGIIVGLFVGVSIRQALGDSTDVPGTVRADNLTVNTSGQYENGLIVAGGNALVAGNIGVCTTTPTTSLDVVGDIKSTTQLCVGATCITENELQIMKSQSQSTSDYAFVLFTRIGSGTVKIADMVKISSFTILFSPEGKASWGISSNILPQTISFSPVPDSGNKFVKWSGDCSGFGTGDICSINVKPGDAINVTIEFAPENNSTSYNLAVIKEGTGTGTVVSTPTGIDCGSVCAHTFSSGTSVTLTATPASGSTFTGWTSMCSGKGSCTVPMDANKSITAAFTSETGGTVCTGTPPPTGTGVVVNPYTTVVISPYTGSSNTVWGYATDVVGGPSCTWSCTSPMERNGNIGCKAPVSGSGVTVKINNLSTGQPFPGVNVLPVSVIGISTAAALGMNGESSGIFTTGTDGKTAEFKFGNMGWTQMEIKSPGSVSYKIRSADGCTAKVSIYANRQLNQCPGAANGKSVTINLVPGDISTSPTTHFEKLTYHRGETLKGSITGGDPNDTWACMDTPITASDRLCNSGRTDAWRKLTVPYDGHADGWHLVETNQGDSIQLGGLLIEQGFPLGTYTQYVKTGQWGTPGQTTSKSITVVQ